MESCPLVLILGWAGSQDRHLTPIVDWYAALEYRTRQFTASASSYLRHPRGIEKHIAKLADQVEQEIGNPPRPLLVHLFSNNGFVTLSALLRILRQQGKWNLVNRALKAIIVDSAPSFTPQMSSWQGADAYARGVAAMAHPLLPLSREKVFTLFRPPLAAAFWLHFSLRQGATTYMRAIAETILDTAAPILLLAGRRDNAVPLDRIRAFAAASEARGHHTILREFDADHVQLALRYRQQYFSEVQNFLRLASDLKIVS